MINLTIFLRLYYGFCFIMSLYLISLALIKLQRSRIRIFGILVSVYSLHILSILINILSDSSLAIVYSQKLLIATTIFLACLWLMFLYELSNNTASEHFRAVTFYNVLISSCFTFLFFSSFETNLFFTSYEIHKYYGLKLVEYEKTIIYDIYTVYTSLLYFVTTFYCMKKYKTSNFEIKKFLKNCAVISFLAGITTILDYFLFCLVSILIVPVVLIFGLIFCKSLPSFTYTGTKYSNVFSNLRESVIILDKKGKVVHCNTKAFEIFPELAEKNFPLDYKYITSIPISEILTGRLTKFKHIIPNTNEKKLFNIVVSELNPNIKHFEGIHIMFYDNTEYKKLQDKYITSTKFDYLTGIYNKVFFNRYGNNTFNDAINNDLKLSLLILDIDNFHFINENFSNEIGDKVLNDLVLTYKKVVKDHNISTSSIFRLSGDIFAVIFTDIDLEATLNVSEALREAIENTPIVSSTNVINYTVSGGLEMLQMSTAITFERLIHNAKLKVNYAKEGGKNQIVYRDTNK